MADRLTHLDAEGRVQMVDVSTKAETVREAEARARVRMRPETFALVRGGAMRKGDVLAVAQIAGIQGAKRTAELIPLCHPIPLSHADVEVVLVPEVPGVEIIARCRTRAATGVEMEALTAAAVAALAIVDMCKAVERGLVITDLRVVRKSGGRSGAWEEKG